MTSMHHVSKNMILNSIRTKHNSGAELINITLEAGFLKAKVLLYLMLLAVMEIFCVF